MLRLTYLNETAGVREPFDQPTPSLELVYEGSLIRLYRPDADFPLGKVCFAHLSTLDGLLHAGAKELPCARIEDEAGGRVELEIGDWGFVSPFFELRGADSEQPHLFAASGEEVACYSYEDKRWLALGKIKTSSPYGAALFSVHYKKMAIKPQTRSRASALAK